MAEKQIRINLTVPPGMYEQIERYADVLGIRVTEAARYLMYRGLEQVRVLQTSADSASALKAMTEVFEMELEREEKAKKSSKATVRVPVTPEQIPENRKTKKSRSTVKDIFND